MDSDPKFIAAADIHLNLHMWNTNKAIMFDSLFSFYALLNIANSYQIPLVIAGDILDTKMIGPDLFLYISAIRNRFPDVPIYYITGNHDPGDPHWFSHLPNTIRLGKDPVTINGVTVVGIDYKMSGDFADALKEVYPFADVLVTHQTYNCFFKSAAAIDHTLLKNRHLVISGDYHMNLDTYIDDQDRTYIVSPGSATRCTIAEHDPTALLVSKWADKGDLWYSTVYLPHRQFINVADIEVACIEGMELEEYAASIDSVPVLRYTGGTGEIIDYDDFIFTVSGTFSKLQRPPQLGLDTLSNAYIARTKAHAAMGKDLITMLKTGYLLYSPELPKPTEQPQLQLLPDTRDTATAYLQDMLSAYPCDDKVKLAAAEFLFNDSSTFIAAESKRFGVT